ncbi:hypothetical protein ACRALDRAFT_1072461 [Sodiomyces alcalophilus JCM 7366]|uniref:uncharacterized protein n=1 Tax=Sodiomyces alcalophilus JCM 7366 TaxID=591952 RepID=UPI0039B5F3A6
MAAPSIDRHEDTPFLLRLFYREGSFHRPEEFAARTPPPSLPLYAWHDCTLNELALQMASERPSLLPTPAFGTRLAFRLVIPDTRGAAGAASSGPHYPGDQARFMVKDLGSIVIGEDVSGFANGSDTVGNEELDATGRPPSPVGGKGEKGGSAGDTTLQSARFVIGDYVSCAILPPLPDGSVAPEPSKWEAPLTRHERGLGGLGPYSHGGGRRDIGFGRGRRDHGRSGFGSYLPRGDWRRGERLPDQGPDRSWGGRYRRGG